MTDETPTETQQIAKAEKAKWSGIVSGVLAGVVSNWREIALILTLVHSLWSSHEEKKDISIAKQQQGLLWHETHQIEQGTK